MNSEASWFLFLFWRAYSTMYNFPDKIAVLCGKTYDIN